LLPMLWLEDIILSNWLGILGWAPLRAEHLNTLLYH
jgi:hypothetical protein